MAAPGTRDDIPRGIEVLVKKASVDREFKALLLEKRARAAEEIGLQLTEAEAGMLDAVSDDQLAAIIRETRVEPKHRSAFLGKGVVAMLAVVAGGAVVASLCCPSLGHRADLPPRQQIQQPTGQETAAPASQPAEEPAPDPTDTPEDERSPDAR